MVHARVTKPKTPLQRKASIADPKIDKLAHQIAERRRDLPPDRRRHLAKMIAQWARAFGLPNSE